MTFQLQFFCESQWEILVTVFSFYFWRHRKKSFIQKKKKKENFTEMNFWELAVWNMYFSQTDTMTSCHLLTCVIPLCLLRQSYCTSEIHEKRHHSQSKNPSIRVVVELSAGPDSTFVSLSTNISLNLFPALLSSLTLYLVKKHTDTCTPLFLSQWNLSGEYMLLRLNISNHSSQLQCIFCKQIEFPTQCSKGMMQLCSPRSSHLFL